MKTHPYLRAYMAGAAAPTVLVLVAFAVFLTVRPVNGTDFPAEKVMVFPLAVVPALWGLWNMLWVALHTRARWPLGLHGAIVPAFAVPLGFAAAQWNGVQFPVSVAQAILIIAPLLMIIYYLVWKFVVGFLNGLLGIG